MIVKLLDICIGEFCLDFRTIGFGSSGELFEIDLDFSR